MNDSPKHPAAARPSAIRRAAPLLLAVLLFALVAALFAPSVGYGLVDLDDHAYITQNRIVLQGLSLPGIRRAFSPSNATATMYMPLLWISYMADVTLFGASNEHPAAFHAVNVALHALAAVLLFFLLRTLAARAARTAAPPLWTPFLLALLWAVHPLRVESVAWVTERKDVLSAVFGLAATLCWLGSARDARRLLPRSLLLAAALLLYAAGLLVKPSLVPLPAAWLVFDLWPLRRIPVPFRGRPFLPAALRAAAEKLLFLPAALAAAWMAVASHHAVSGSLAVSWPVRLSVVAPNFLFYLRKTLWPAGLSPLVPERWIFPASTVLLSLLVCAVLAAAVWSFRRALPSLLPGAAWTLLFFLPASGLQPLPMNTVADRFFYLPAIGLSIALLSLPAALSSRPRFRAACLALALAVLATLAALSARLLPVWTSTVALYRHVASVFPANPLAVSDLAKNAIRSSGDFAAADALLAPALAENPEAWLPRIVHADCLLQLESSRAAIDYLARSRMPEDLYTSASLFFTLANYEFFAGDFESAIRHAEKAISLYTPDSTARTPALCLALGAAFEAGDLQQALAFARRTRIYSGATAVTIENLLPLAVFHWAYCYRAQALPLLYRILDASPDRPDLCNNILWGLATAEWSPADPAEVLARTLRMQAQAPIPDHPGILDTVAAAHANAGDFPAALQAIDQALARVTDPADPFRARLLARRELFLQGKPYREKAFDRLFSATFGSPADAL